MADPGFPRRGRQAQTGANLLFGKIFDENCMKIKHIGLRRGAIDAHSLDPSLLMLW